LEMHGEPCWGHVQESASHDLRFEFHICTQVTQRTTWGRPPKTSRAIVLVTETQLVVFGQVVHGAEHGLDGHVTTGTLRSILFAHTLSSHTLTISNDTLSYPYKTCQHCSKKYLYCSIISGVN
jgi:hypothetical protein